jgi:hypothetical protein
MNELSNQELGHFVDSLSPHQRVVLQRVLGECLTVLPQKVDEATPDRMQLVEEGMRPLTHLLSYLRQFSPADDASDNRPFAVSMLQPGHALVTLSRRILTWHAIWDAKSYAWLKAMRIDRLTADVSALDELNSSTIAWLVTLAQQLPGGLLVLRGANHTMRRALGVLHLEKVLVASL